MKPLKSHEIKGNWVTLLLPVNDDESIDYARLEDVLERITSFQPDGIYSNGTAGEFYNTTEQEFDKIAEILAAKCEKTNVPFQIGVSHMSPVISLQRLKRVVDLKPSAVQVILPDWFVPTDEEVISFLQKMAEEAGEIGLILYNPPHAKRNLQPAEFLKIKKAIPQLVGVKVPDGDSQWYQEMVAVAKEISVFIPGHKIATGRKMGVSHGAYSNMACLNPKAAQIWTDQIENDLTAALELEARILEFMRLYIAPYITQHKYANQAVDKMLATIGNWADIGPRLRWPYRWIPVEHAKELQPIARQYLPEFFIDI